MKRILIILTVILFIPLSTVGQNFFFIGENSYPSTETYTLQSNSDINDLDVLFAKDEEKALIIVSSKLVSTVRITGKLIIYLDDGTVVSSNKEVISDNVDDIASTVYELTDKDLSKLKTSNINTIRYEIKSTNFLARPTSVGNHSASNNGDSKIDFPALVTDFFDENKNKKSDSNKEYLVQSNKQSKNVKSAPYELKWEGDIERNPMVQPLPDNIADAEATITIRFEVKPDGTVGRIVPLKEMNPELEREVMRTLRSWRFSRLPSGVPQQSQWATITFRFVVE